MNVLERRALVCDQVGGDLLPLSSLSTMSPSSLIGKVAPTFTLKSHDATEYRFRLNFVADGNEADGLGLFASGVGMPHWLASGPAYTGGLIADPQVPILAPNLR